MAENLGAFLGLLTWPDFSQLANPAIYSAALTIAMVATMETLLNIEAVDKLDPDQRSTLANRELIEDFRQKTSAAHGVRLSMVGFKDDFQFDDHIQYVDYTSRDMQSDLPPERVLKILQDGNERFLSGVQAGLRIPGFKKFFLNNLPA